MTGNILELITEQYQSLTPSNRKLANYILANTRETQYMSISSLAECSGVSEATITRFCRSLGLSGYNSLKLALAKSVHVTNVDDHSGSSGNMQSGDTPSTIFPKIYDECMLSLNETLELLDEKEINRAVDLISAADRVFCFGQGGSMVMAMEAWARFSTATSRFVHIEDTHMQAMSIALATERDVILFFSYSGSTKDMEDIMRIAEERHVSVILVTHFPNSYAAQHADVVLLCGYSESPLQSGSGAAKIGQLFIIECLFSIFYERNPELYFKTCASTVEAIMPKLL